MIRASLLMVSLAFLLLTGVPMIRYTLVYLFLVGTAVSASDLV